MDSRRTASQALFYPPKRSKAKFAVPPTLDDLLLLKHRWGVSAAAIIMQLKALEMLDEDGALMVSNVALLGGVRNQTQETRTVTTRATSPASSHH